LWYPFGMISNHFPKENTSIMHCALCIMHFTFYRYNISFDTTPSLASLGSPDSGGKPPPYRGHEGYAVLTSPVRPLIWKEPVSVSRIQTGVRRTAAAAAVSERM